MGFVQENELVIKISVSGYIYYNFTGIVIDVSKILTNTHGFISEQQQCVHAFYLIVMYYKTLGCIISDLAIK